MVDASIILGNVNFWIVLLSIAFIHFLYIGKVKQLAVKSVLGKRISVGKGYLLFLYELIFMIIANLLILFVLSLLGLVTL